MVPPSQFCSFLWNLFLSYYLKTNKVKYIKIYIFSKGISQEIYLNRQILVKDCIFEKSPKKCFFFVCLFVFVFCFVLFYFCPNFIFIREKISLDKNNQKNCETFYILYMCISTECFLTFVINILFLKIWAFFCSRNKLLFNLKWQSKATFYHYQI